jgi:hypothetical protein
MRKNHRIWPESPGKRWKMEAVFQSEIDGFFSGVFRSSSSRKAQETDRNP